MDSKSHPIVVQGLKAAELASESKYREDYMDTRDLIYYPVHLTPGYEAAVKANVYHSDVSKHTTHYVTSSNNLYFRKVEYHKGLDKIQANIHYDFTDTEKYKTVKDHQNATGEVYTSSN